MTVTWSWDIEAYISAAWVSIKRDVEVFKTPTVAKRGINGSGITNRVAAPGSLSTSLDNGESNSGGKLGYYSPEHANMRANFGRNTKIRISITYSGSTRYVWYGYITNLDPTVGQFKERSTKLYGTDYMQRMNEQNLQLIAVQQDQRSDQIFQTLIDSMAVAPLNTSISTDKFKLPFALSGEADEKTKVMGAVQKLCQTVLAYCFPTGNATDGETLVFQREEDRALLTSSATLDDTMSEMTIKRSTDDMRNRIVGKVHPTRMDEDATTLLYENDSNIYVDGGDTQTFTFRFRDPNNQSSRISALEVVSPLVADVHYRGSKYDEGSEADATSLLSITPTNGANSAEWVVENTGGYRVYINLVNIFGKGLYYYNAVTLTAESGDGDKESSYDFYYLADSIRARGFLARLLDRTSASTPDVEAVSFFADADATLMGYAMSLDIGDRVTLIETATGLSGQYTINNVTYSFETDGRLKVTWGVEPADTNSYFILDSSELDGTDVLSPY